MTVKEFLMQLSAETKQRRARWVFVTSAGCLRSGYGDCHCPLTFVAGNCELTIDEAADALGLPFSWAQRIADAADGFEYAEPMRKRLLKACGLEKA